MQALRSIRILYHYPCPDGVFAAFAANLHFTSSLYKATPLDLKFLPHSTFKKLEWDSHMFEKHSEVFLLDYCGPENFCI